LSGKASDGGGFHVDHDGLVVFGEGALFVRLAT